MGFASYQTSVDATIGRPHVVTLGVRERVVKPATEFAGKFAMSRIAFVPIKKFSTRLLGAVGLAAAYWLFACPAIYAGVASSQFRVTARVIKSCKVSTDALAAKAANAGGTINVDCQNNTPSAGDAAGATPPSATANVTYSVDEVSGSDGTLKIVTVNY
jgi:hypothetical protein